MIDSQNAPILIKCLEAFQERPKDPTKPVYVHYDYNLAATDVLNFLEAGNYSSFPKNDFSIMSRALRYVSFNQLFPGENDTINAIYWWCVEQLND